MLRPFQVNVGSYLTLTQDILPTSKVSELCSCIEAVSGENIDSQVLLAADGRQMDTKDLIGNYSVGTEEKPLFVFYRSYINNNDPPTTFSRLPQRGGLQKQLEILKQRPSPSLFQHQVALSKHLCEYSMKVGKLCEMLAEEYGLQLSGWKTVLSNCSNLIGMFQKHHQLFCKAVEKFREDKPHHLELLQQFPEQVKLLQQLPMPSSLHTSTLSSLYDWISTHDEKNSLMDLSIECKKALAKVDGEQLETALLSSEEINGKSSEIFDSENKSLEAGEKIKSESSEVRGIMETIMGLGKNIQLTSDKAFRSGDAKTIAVLVESHHNSLQLMANHSSQLEAIARGVESCKRTLTCHIHSRLKLVMQLQKKVADSNGQLVLLHEHIKLARRRFEILDQVCSTPQVLVEVFAEVSRRRAYNAALEKVMKETILRLQKAREEEKRLRKSFQSNHGVHFVTSLFSELQDRVPDITFHSPKSLSKTHDDNLEAICSHLPQNTRPLASSLQILVDPIPSASDSELPVSPKVPGGTSRGDSFKLVKSDSDTPPHPGGLADSGGVEELEGSSRDAEKLKELVGKLELSNLDFSTKLQQSLQDKQTLQAEKESAHFNAVQKLKDSEELVLSLRHRISELQTKKESFHSEEVSFRHHVEDLERKNSESVEKLTKMSQELEVVSAKCSQLTSEREEAVSNVERLNEMIGKLQFEHTQTTRKLERDCAQLQDNLTQTQVHQKNELLALQTLLAQSNSDKEQLVESSEESRSKEMTLESRLSELKESWSLQQQSLEGELARCREEQEVQKGVLSKHSSVSDELTAVRGELQEKENALEACTVELSLLRREKEEVQGEVRVVKEELDRQQQRCQQAQATMNSNRAQLQAVDAKRKELVTKLEEKEVEKREISTELELTRCLLLERESELTTQKAKYDTEVRELNERALAAQQRTKEIENGLNQKEPRINDLEKKLNAAEARISELEADLSKKKEKLLCVEGRLQQAEQELYMTRSDLDRRTAELQTSTEGKARQKDELNHRLQETQAKLEKSIRELEARKSEWSTERDGYIIQVMELEREVKQLRRDAGQDSPPSSAPPRKQVIQRMSSSAVEVGSVASVASPPTSPEVDNGVAIQSLQLGQIALFMCDQYGNYLALSVDGKTYYLDSESTQNLRDLTTRMPQLNLKRKILVGKITGRLYMEVRKESNRLKVPVGSRLYKLQAEEVAI